jgi:hypothetical protein
VESYKDRRVLTPLALYFRTSSYAMPANLKTLDPEDELLSLGSSHDSRGVGSNHAVRTAPVFTKEVLDVVGNSVLPQRALYGSILAQRATGFPEILDPFKAKLYVNTNSPFSGVVCGVQVRP